LTNVKLLVQLHGGTVRAKSPGSGFGSEFTLRLPVAPAPAAVSRGETAPTAPVPVRRVLVVDDNIDAAATLGMWLEMLGHQVQVAHGGQEALQLVRTFAPEVALLDLGMPDVSRYEVARVLRNTTGHRVLLVALTGWGQEEDRRRTSEAGFQYHLV
jgi:CheY-like chemotaxis protein